MDNGWEIVRMFCTVTVTFISMGRRGATRGVGGGQRVSDTGGRILLTSRARTREDGRVGNTLYSECGHIR